MLAGCGDSGWDLSDTSDSESAATQTTISGSVGDGPIVGGTVVVRDVTGAIVATDKSDTHANYHIGVNVGNHRYPLTITVMDGIDLVTGNTPDFALIATVLAPGSSQTANLNPFGTLAVEVARNMVGGLSQENLDRAIETVMATQNSGLDTTHIPNPITSEITSENSAYIIKSSEALGETVRRTTAALTTIGQPIVPDQVIDGSDHPAADSNEQSGGRHGG